MTERLADITARVDSISALGSVVNAMKGIAAARARMARTQVDEVEAYTKRREG
jgi:F-type H+-transporting ATPase subunit gamma